MDDSVGVSLYSAGAPMNSYVPLSIAQTNQHIQYIRISYADYGFHGNEINLRHSQIVHCGSAIFGDEGPCNVDNLLIYDVATAFSGQVYYGSATHLTIDKCNLLAEDLYDPTYSFIAFTNCLITAVTNMGDVAFTTNSTVILSDSSGLFQTVGAAGHYLGTNSIYRGAGNTNISSWLAADLQKMTTYAPVVLQPAAVTTNSLTLSPQVQRDSSHADIGYHYVPLDYAVADVALYTTNASLTIKPGTAIGTFQRPVSGYSFYLLDGAKITSEGSPINPIHIARYNMVQEQANTNWTDTRGQSVVTYCSTPDALPSARFRFTEWSTPAQDTYHFFGSDIGYNFPVAFVDNQFRGGMFLSCRPTLGVTNSLFEKVSSVLSDANAAFDAAFQHNLFYGGPNRLQHVDIGTCPCRDNLFRHSGSSVPRPVA